MSTLSDSQPLLKQAFADSDGEIRSLASKVEQRMKVLPLTPIQI